jgi:hypothetical protein
VASGGRRTISTIERTRRRNDRIKNDCPAFAGHSFWASQPRQHGGAVVASHSPSPLAVGMPRRLPWLAARGPGRQDSSARALRPRRRGPRTGYGHSLVCGPWPDGNARMPWREILRVLAAAVVVATVGATTFILATYALQWFSRSSRCWKRTKAASRRGSAGTYLAVPDRTIVTGLSAPPRARTGSERYWRSFADIGRRLGGNFHA